MRSPKARVRKRRHTSTPQDASRIDVNREANALIHALWSHSHRNHSRLNTLVGHVKAFLDNCVQGLPHSAFKPPDKDGQDCPPHTSLRNESNQSHLSRKRLDIQEASASDKSSGDEQARTHKRQRIASSETHGSTASSTSQSTDPIVGCGRRDEKNTAPLFELAEDPDERFAKQIIQTYMLRNGPPCVGSPEQWWSVVKIVYNRRDVAEWKTLEMKQASQRIKWEAYRRETLGAKGRKRKTPPKRPNPLPTTEEWAQIRRQRADDITKNVIKMAGIFGRAGLGRFRDHLQITHARGTHYEKRHFLLTASQDPNACGTVKQLLAHFDEGEVRRGMSANERFRKVVSNADMYEALQRLVKEFGDVESDTRAKMSQLGFINRTGAGAQTQCTAYALHIYKGWPVEQLLAKVEDFPTQLRVEYDQWQEVLTKGKSYSLFRQIFGRAALILVPEDLTV